MPSQDKSLEKLLELEVRAHARSRIERLHLLLHAALELVEADGVAVVSHHRRRVERLVLRAGAASPESLEPVRRGSEGCRLVARAPLPIALGTLGENPRLALEDGCPGLTPGPALFAPLRQRDESPGYLAFYRGAEGARFGDGEARVAGLLAAWGAMAFEHLRLAESLEKLAVTDDLTQVYNYRFLKSALRREMKRAGRFGQELSIVMLDVDNLKSYNDRHGHMRGSELLREIALLLRDEVRSFDLIAKYGGDEFTVILPQTGREGSCVVAERMRAAVERHAFALAAAGEITISLGIAVFPHDAENGHDLIRASDRALYRAKQDGRNRVEAHPPAGADPTAAAA